MSVASNYGSGFFPNGTDFPFVKPSTDIKGLFEDLHLCYEGEFALPLRVSLVSGFDASNPANSLVEIRDSENALVFSTLSAIDNDISAWGSRRLVYVWRNNSAVLTVVQYSDTVIEAASSSSSSSDGSSSFVPTSAVLDERTYLRDVIKVNKIKLGAVEIAGDINLVGGNNFVFNLLGATSVEGRRKVNRVQVAATPGTGTGIFPECPEDCIQGGIKTVNGVKPDSYGNISIATKECYWTGLEGTGDATDYTATTTGQIDFNNNCSPCCECNDFVKTYEGIRRLHTKFKAIGSRSMTVRGQHYANQNRWSAARTCREENSIRIFALPLEGAKTSILVSFCNVSQVTIGPIRLEVDLSSGENLGNIESVIWYPTDASSPTEVTPEGEWPNYIFRWESLKPGKSAKVRFTATVLSPTDGDLILINAQAVLDSSDEIVSIGEPYSLGLKL
jgi:hypothetical protein